MGISVVKNSGSVDNPWWLQAIACFSCGYENPRVNVSDYKGWELYKWR